MVDVIVDVEVRQRFDRAPCRALAELYAELRFLRELRRERAELLAEPLVSLWLGFGACCI